ncbi:MAG: MMPL family transporter [Planctomycetaceae bacterium]|nr:MMPL family transporter [Planctomycetaceae bacterium]
MAALEPAAAAGGVLSVVTRRPIAIGMLMLALVVFGLASFLSLRQDLLPEISYPTLTVRTSWPGAGPEDVEQRVSVRVQEALGTLPGLVRTSSTSRAATSDVVLEFDWGTPMTFAVQDVREKLDGVFLPAGVERPLILRYDPSLDPILRIGMTSRRGEGDERSLVALRWLAEQRVERELESLAGVAAVLVRGGLEEEIHVQLDPDRVAALNLDPAQIGQRLAQENVNAAGGIVREGSTDYVVRTINEFQNPDEIADLALARRGSAVVRVRDVATVKSHHRRREVTSRINGAEAVEIAIYREAGANIVDLAERVRTAVFGTEAQRQEAERIDREGKAGTVGERNASDYLARRLKDDAELTLLSDQSVFIRDAIKDVQSAAGIGALLAVVVILAFLRRAAPTFIIAVSIPMSVVVTFAPMHLAGVSLNLMSLGGLALGVGMLVDNAIVVLESIARCREEGDDLRSAAVRGVREVASAVTASTLTTVGVFAPIVFVGGIAGQVFRDQALTVVTALLISLLVAVLFIPMLASRGWLVGERKATNSARRPLVAPWRGLSFRPAQFLPSVFLFLGRSVLFVLAGLSAVVGFVVLALWRLIALLLTPLGKAFELAWSLFARTYQTVLRAALAAPSLVLLLVGLLAYDAFRRVPNLGVELLPEVHQGEFTAFVQLQPGTPLEDTARVLGELDLLARAEPLVETTALTVGVEADTLTRDVEGSHTARLSVRLEPDHGGKDGERELAERLRATIAGHPAVVGVELRRPTPFAIEAPLSVEVRGHDLERMGEVAAQVEHRLLALPELADVRSSLRPGFPELQLTFDRDRTLEFGLDLAAVSKLVRDQVLGDVPTRFTRGDERIDVRVLADEARLGSLEDVLNLSVNPSADVSVPLRAVASASLIQGPAEIRRVGNGRAIVIDATPVGIDLGGTRRAVENALYDLTVPEDVTVSLGGQTREMDEATGEMRFALLLAVFLVYVVMASQFESLLQPLIILVSVPLAAIGVVYVLEAVGTPLSVIASIGLILLAGIVVNNAIVLIDRVNRERTRGHDAREALLLAASARLRPILMTTATTVLGLLPMTGWLGGVPLIGALGAGEGAELRAPMAVVVVTGLVGSTLLTLVVIPAVYLLISRWERRPAAI